MQSHDMQGSELAFLFTEQKRNLKTIFKKKKVSLDKIEI